MKLKYLSHSAFQITTEEGLRILIDPFLDRNPNAPVTSDELLFADFIVLTHAHGDHLGDAKKIAKIFNSQIICVNELGIILEKQGFNTHKMHIGGSHPFPFGKVKFTIAHHGSSTDEMQYAGEPAGVLLFIEDKIIYHTGDTGLFFDMKLIGEINKIDYMLLPIGDNFTMGIDDAVRAVEFVNPNYAVPMHYNTFPIIAADPYEFKSKVEQNGKQCRVMEFGEEISIN
ncbi:MAG: metal-dependent hydrolase [Ignavibacteriaceae bacterium]|jgi:L-ascorbate metabolism protein UlaG (beta-lactamase superfamily)|nr:metal-dependent hydrolase [Ignavibacteriaceae bacterium]